MNDFSKRVIDCIHSIPKGRVATYGQIAALAGKPQGSRGVAWILHSSSTVHKLPWHRVVNSQGRISFQPGTHNFRQQKNRLKAEGVAVSAEGKLTLSQWQWEKKARRARVRGPRMFGR